MGVIAMQFPVIYMESNCFSISAKRSNLDYNSKKQQIIQLVRSNNNVANHRGHNNDWEANSVRKNNPPF